ncbi:hypothetical protein Vafri_2981 [Volvox africanus]|nr:hypothetical protein Vafri_2981 [Volvox africanus]
MTKTSLSFYAYWSAIVDTYKLHKLLPRGDISLHNFFVNKRAKFQEAWVNYIMLQHPDYSKAFRCQCPDADYCQELVADGIMLGPQKNRSQLFSNWGPGPESELFAG